MTDERFEICWPLVLKQECPYPDAWQNAANFSNDLGDPGGATMCGIIQVEYNYYRARKGLKWQSVRYITRQEGHDIYYNSYWLPHCPVLPLGLDLQFFDAAVNTGPVEAIRILQSVLGIANDGVWGPKTMEAVQAIRNLKSINVAFRLRRELVYRLMPNFGRFGKGWEHRASSIGSTAMEMIV